ncbi:MAG: hypothetical protein EAX86_01030 [Candidatus Heimdallarchaeota archaeon]|nr:hypothetical protein [Candidatus Heimdallarchaeota archaeon]
MPLDTIFSLLVTYDFIILIIGGLLAAAWLTVRLAGVSDEDISKTVRNLSIIGFPVGVIALITIGAGIYVISKEILIPETFDLVTVICLGLLGLVLILRPIKDFRFGAFLSLAIGLLGAGLVVMLGADSVKLLAGVFIIIFLIIYGAIKIFEDMYQLIAEILASPLVSVSIGLITIIQGILLIFNLSLGGLLTFLALKG